MRRLSVASVIVPMVALFASLEPTALAQPYDTVYVYSGEGDAFRNVGDGFVRSQLGLVDANGRPAVRGTGAQQNDLVNSRGEVVGHVILDANNNLIGVTNRDRTQAAYNVAAGATTDQAWLNVNANGGTLHIVSHGANRADPADPQGTIDGGGIMLDGQFTFSGFRARGTAGGGTGVDFSADGSGAMPYDLTPRPGANITINVNGCWTRNDPDGPGPERSVTSTAGTVPGVGAVEGHDVVVNTNLAVNLTGTAGQVAAAQTALIAAAVSAGFGNAVNGPPATLANANAWLRSLPLNAQHANLSLAIAGTGATGSLAYSKAEVVPGGRPQAASPVLVQPLASGSFQYGDPNPQGRMTASVTVTPGALAAPTMFLFAQLAETPGNLPSGSDLASGIFDFRYPGTNPFLEGLLIYRIDFIGPTEGVRPFSYDPVRDLWSPLSTFRIEGGTLIASWNQVGIVAVLIPAPGVLAAIGMALIAVPRRRAPRGH